MSSVAPLTVPGLSGRTVLVTDAGTAQGTAQCLVLLASGADVIAVDPSPALPTALVDAGTGLPGTLAYRPLGSGWAALADWIGEHHAGLGGMVLNAGRELDTALHPHLSEDCAIVDLGQGAEPAAGDRWNRVVVADGKPRPRDAERFAAVVAFLLSDLSRPVHGAQLPVRSSR